MQTQLVIFDLDGTLLDTLLDLQISVNAALATQTFPPRSLAEVRSFVGNGIRLLVERAVPATATPAQVDAVFAAFNESYAIHCSDHTRPYDGVCELLDQLHADGVKTAVVSNKADYAVQSLCAHYFPGKIDFTVGARDGVRKKPAPDAVLEVLKTLGVPENRAIYVGDSDVDVRTAQNAKLACIAVDWGFRDRSVLEQAGASTIVSTPAALYAKLR